MLRMIALLCLSLAVCWRVQAESTIEELNEGHKSLFSSITSVTGKTESNRHHVKATFDGPSHGVGAQSGSAYDTLIVSSRGASGSRNGERNEDFVRGTGIHNGEEFGYNEGTLEEVGSANDERTGYDGKPDSYQPFPGGFNPVPPVSNTGDFVYGNVNTQEFSKGRSPSLPSDYGTYPLVGSNNNPVLYGSAPGVNGFPSSQPGSFGVPNTIPQDIGRGNSYGYGYNGNVPIYGSVNTGSYGAFVPPPMNPYPYGHVRNTYPIPSHHGPTPYPESNNLPNNHNQHNRHHHRHHPHQHDHNCRHNNGYQGPQPYQTLGHTFKMNTEYKEDGQHSGPFKELNSNGNCGYGSGFCGGYNGAFNRPGF